MIDTKRYTLLVMEGYTNKAEAYNVINVYYADMPGVTTFFDNGLWYIVQSKALSV